MSKFVMKTVEEAQEQFGIHFERLLLPNGIREYLRSFYGKEREKQNGMVIDRQRNVAYHEFQLGEMTLYMAVQLADHIKPKDAWHIVKERSHVLDHNTRIHPMAFVLTDIYFSLAQWTWDLGENGEVDTSLVTKEKQTILSRIRREIAPSKKETKIFFRMIESLSKNLVTGMQIAEIKFHDNGNIGVSILCGENGSSVIHSIEDTCGKFFERELDFVLQEVPKHYLNRYQNTHRLFRERYERLGELDDAIRILHATVLNEVNIKEFEVSKYLKVSTGDFGKTDELRCRFRKEDGEFLLRIDDDSIKSYRVDEDDELQPMDMIESPLLVSYLLLAGDQLKDSPEATLTKQGMKMQRVVNRIQKILIDAREDLYRERKFHRHPEIDKYIDLKSRLAILDTLRMDYRDILHNLTLELQESTHAKELLNAMVTKRKELGKEGFLKYVYGSELVHVDILQSIQIEDHSTDKEIDLRFFSSMLRGYRFWFKNDIQSKIDVISRDLTTSVSVYWHPLLARTALYADLMTIFLKRKGEEIFGRAIGIWDDLDRIYELSPSLIERGDILEWLPEELGLKNSPHKEYFNLSHLQQSIEIYPIDPTASPQESEEEKEKRHEQGEPIGTIHFDSLSAIDEKVMRQTERSASMQSFLSKKAERTLVEPNAKGEANESDTRELPEELTSPLLEPSRSAKHMIPDTDNPQPPEIESKTVEQVAEQVLEAVKGHTYSFDDEVVVERLKKRL